jgi:hypothetical protein
MAQPDESKQQPRASDSPAPREVTELTNGQFRDIHGQVHDGLLLGDGLGGIDGCWWIRVDALKSVFQFYPNHVETSPSTGLPLVWGYDFSRTFAQLSDDDVAKQFFADARDPAQLVGLTRILSLISP